MDILKKIKEILKKGSITADQKKSLKKDFEKLSKETQEVIKSDYDKAMKLKEVTVNENDVTSELKKLIAPIKDEAVAKAVKEAVEKVEDKVAKVLEDLKKQKEDGVGIGNPAIKNDVKRKAMNDLLRKTCRAVMLDNPQKMGEVMDRIEDDTNWKTILRKELTTDDESSPYGGFVVDSELSAEIRHLMTEYGVARREMFSTPLSKGSLKANNLATDVTVAWVSEQTAISSNQIVLGQETLELEKLAVIVSMSSELLEDQEIDLFQFIATRVAENFAKKEDEAFFKGDGTSSYGSFTGLLIDTNVNEVTMTGTTFASLDADDLLDMIDAQPQGAIANAKFYMHRTIMSIVRRLKEDNGDYIYQRPSEKGPGTIWGFPVVLVEAMPSKTDTAADTSFVLFADLKKGCILGYKGAIKAKRFDAGVIANVAGNDTINLITQDTEAIRWTERVGYIIIIPTAITKLTTASSSA